MEPTTYNTININNDSPSISTNNSNKKLIILVILVVIVIIFASLTYLISNKINNSVNQGTNISHEDVKNEKKDYMVQEFKRDNLGFSLEFPSSWKLTTYDESTQENIPWKRIANINPTEEQLPNIDIFIEFIEENKLKEGTSSSVPIVSLDPKKLPKITTWYEKEEEQEFEIAGHEVEVITKVEKNTAPTGKLNEDWCNCSERTIFIALDNNKILVLIAKWKTTDKEFELKLEETYRAIKFLK